MSTIPARATPPPRQDGPRPTWEIAYLFPAQGHWSEGDYLALNGNYLIEFIDGRVEVLPMPTMRHQLIVAFLVSLLQEFVRPRSLGTVLFAPLRVRVRPGQYREPDVVFMAAEHRERMGNDFWEGADLVVEVVSDDDRKRDLETKRFEYAQAGIPEYWIVDPQRREISVLKLAGDRYEEVGVFRQGERASSALLAGLQVDVAAVFAAGEVR